jgi:putative acetyltransferase
LVRVEVIASLPIVLERPYEITDTPAVIAIYTAAIHELAAPFYSPQQLAAWAPATTNLARWQQRLSQVHTLVTEHDSVLAGFASYTDDGYLDLLFTAPAFARRGVATRLYLRVEATLRAAGVPKIFTRASLAARPFFDRHGFQFDAEEHIECRGAYLRRSAMHKPLRN